MPQLFIVNSTINVPSSLMQELQLTSTKGFKCLMWDLGGIWVPKSKITILKNPCSHLTKNRDMILVLTLKFPRHLKFCFCTCQGSSQSWLVPTSGLSLTGTWKVDVPHPVSCKSDILTSLLVGQAPHTQCRGGSCFPSEKIVR